jgi:uncharacterized protein YtpQ (UPF0354 family)
MPNICHNNANHGEAVQESDLLNAQQFLYYCVQCAVRIEESNPAEGTNNLRSNPSYQNTDPYKTAEKGMLLFHDEGNDETKNYLAYGGGKSKKYYRVPKTDGKERICKHPPEIGKSGKGKFSGSSPCKVQISE